MRLFVAHSICGCCCDWYVYYIPMLVYASHVITLPQHGDTPLHYACIMGHHDVVLILLERGANATDKNEVRVITDDAKCHIITYSKKSYTKFMK